MFFPIEGRPMGDHFSVFQEVPWGSPTVFQLFWSFFVVEEFRTKFQDTLLSAFVTIWELRSFWLEYTEIASLVLQPYQEALRWCPRTLPLGIWDSEAPCTVNTALYPSSLTSSPRSTTRTLYFWRCFASSAFIMWQRSSKFAKRTGFQSFLAWRITSNFGLTFFTSNAGVVLNWFHSLSTAALASGIFTASWTETGLCTKLLCKLPKYSAMWSVCCRFTDRRAPVFSGSDSSTAWGFPRLSSFSQHGNAGAVSFSSFRRASAITLKWSLSSVNKYHIDSTVAACCLQFGTCFCPFRSLFSPCVLERSYPSCRPDTVWSASLVEFS